MPTTFLITTKAGMTRLFRADGTAVPVTVLTVVDQKIARSKTADKDGYVAAVIDADGVLKECRAEEVSTDLNTLAPEMKVEIVGISKGKGFAGTIKRHGFHRGPAGHGSKNVRKPGSIGSGYPERVLKGKKMAGHMGVTKNTKKTQVEAVMAADGLLMVRGAIPGSRGSIITVKSL